MKHTIFNHPAIHSATKLFCAAGLAAALFGTSIPSVPVPNSNGRLPSNAEAEIPRQEETNDTGDGHGITPQNDETKAGDLPT